MMLPINFSEVLKNYPNSVFIETGTYWGGGIFAALRANVLGAGFEKIYSIEIDRYRFEDAVKLFEKNTNVIIIYGDSRVKLKEVLEEVSEPATIFLDAHFNRGEVEYFEECPILEELEAIKQHHIKSHTILVDNRHSFLNDLGMSGIKQKTIIRHLKNINENYEITTDYGYIPKRTNDEIIVAKEKTE